METLLEALEIGTIADGWSQQIGIAGAIDSTSLAFRHRELIRREILAVVSRMTWASFAPSNWATLPVGKRIDAIREIVVKQLSCPPHVAAKFAHRLNRLLASLLIRRDVSLADGTRDKLLVRLRGRCGLCGRQFKSAEVSNFLNGNSQQVPPTSERFDRFKPINMTHGDNAIVVDHRVPVSGFGDNELDNLQLACRYCNRIKREWTSIFDRPPRFSDRANGASAFHVIRLIASSPCHVCGKRVSDTELTVFPICDTVDVTLQNLDVTCYEHDPASSIRWMARN